MTKQTLSTLIQGACLISASLMATTSQAEVWPQSEGAYSSTQNSPQWLDQRTPSNQAPRQNSAPNTYPQPYYAQPYPQTAPHPYYGQNYGQNYGGQGNRYYPPQYQGYPPRSGYNQGYYPQSPWNRAYNNMPFFGNGHHGMNPWNGNNFNMPSMPNMNNMPSMPNMEMPSPEFTFPTMNMPSWN